MNWDMIELEDKIAEMEKDLAVAKAALAAQRDGAGYHKLMTRKEYNATTLKGWHSVCHNYDGAGNTAIRYHD